MAINFKDIDTSNVLNNQIKLATDAPQELPRQSRKTPPSTDFVQAAREQSRTQGRKGCKAHRFNMAFTPKAYEFITILSRVRGESITAFVNHIIEQAADDNKELLEQAKAFRDSL